MIWRTATIGVLLALGSLAGGDGPAFLEAAEANPLVGRWDMVVHASDGEYPSWFEVRRSGPQTLVGQFVGRGGSARPISEITSSVGEMSFAIPPQHEPTRGNLSVKGRLDGGRLAGTVTYGDGKPVDFTARRAPSLRRSTQPTWGEPIELFNGQDLAGWHAIGVNRWQAIDGVLSNPAKGGNLATDATFDDFKLHVEFRYPKGGNSGIYLRGRYEVQIEDSAGSEPESSHLGAIYGFLAPSDDVARAPGEWQTFDITLVGRMVTVVTNGKTVICNREIPGITGGSLDSAEGEPGPLVLQGDHTAVDFRKIVLTPAKADWRDTGERLYSPETVERLQ